MTERAITDSLLEKVRETLERTDHLVSLAPRDRLDWKPTLPPNSKKATDLGHLLGHLLDCLSGFCAAFHAAFPKELVDFAELKSLPVNHSCQPEEARTRIRAYSACIDRGFARCTDAELARRVPTVFVPAGETLITILLGNLEHLINHKYQLFFHLKLAGLSLATSDLYRLRGVPERRSSDG